MRYKHSLRILLAAAFVGLLFGHGVHVEVKKLSPVVLVTSEYSEAKPMASAAVTVFAPGEEEKIFQTGRTDTRGAFSFIPDRTGAWKFVVDDEMGHKKEAIIEISEDFFTEKIPAQGSESFSTLKETSFAGLPLFLKLLIGLSLIFGIFGMFSLIKTRKKISGPDNQV